MPMLACIGRLPPPAPSVPRRCYVPGSTIRASMVAAKPPVVKSFDAERNWNDIWHTVESEDRSGHVPDHSITKLILRRSLFADQHAAFAGAGNGQALLESGAGSQPSRAGLLCCGATICCTFRTFPLTGRTGCSATAFIRRQHWWIGLCSAMSVCGASMQAISCAGNLKGCGVFDRVAMRISSR